MKFSGKHFPKDIILQAVRWYLRFMLGYRNLAELLKERGVDVCHTTLFHWVQEYSPQLEAVHRMRRSVCSSSWRMDETYVKVGGKWMYLYRAVDKQGDTVDFLLSKRRNQRAAKRFLNRAIGKHGFPEKVTIDTSGASTAALEQLNTDRKKIGKSQVEVRRIKYLNNIVEQDHRGVKRRMRPILGFQTFLTANRALKGVELCHMIRKGQYNHRKAANDWEYFYSLAS